MKKGIKYNGIPSEKELQGSPCYPAEDIQKEKKVVIIECVQEIPCNPCEEACKFNAIYIGNPITNLPKVNFEKCIGCGQCIAKCPGLAIFLLDYNFNKNNAAISFPYEYYPLPKEGEIVNAVDRNGRYVCKGKVIKVRNPQVNERTAVVTIAFPKKYFKQVRNIQLKWNETNAK
jgi:Fe-S-cluster-containing hydrogenase component 2